MIGGEVGECEWDKVIIRIEINKNILVLQSSHNMRFEEQSKVPGNHVTCYWQGQIIDYEAVLGKPRNVLLLHKAAMNVCDDWKIFESKI